MDTKWLNDPRLKKMHPAKKQVILDLMKEGESKRDMTSIMNTVMETNQKLARRKLSFTPDERMLVVEIMIAGLPNDQQQQAKMFLNMMNTMNPPK